jgi:hypothetical protein
VAVMMKRDAAGAKGAQVAQQPEQKSVQKNALRGMDFAAGEAALSPNGPVQMKGGEEENGETEAESPDVKGGPQSVGRHALLTPAGKLTNVVVSGYPKGNVEIRETKGNRVIIECTNKFTGQIGEKTLAQVDAALGAKVDDQSAANGTMTISRDDGKIARIAGQFGEVTVDQKVVVYVPVGVTATVQ